MPVHIGLYLDTESARAHSIFSLLHIEELKFPKFLGFSCTESHPFVLALVGDYSSQSANLFLIN